MKSILSLFIVLSAFQLQAQIEKPKPAPKPAATPKATTPAAPQATVFVTWTGGGTAKIKIGSVEITSQNGVETKTQLKPNEAFELSVIKPGKTYLYSDFVQFLPGNNYLTINLVSEKIIIAQQSESEHASIATQRSVEANEKSLNASRILMTRKENRRIDSIMARESFFIQKNRVKVTTVKCFYLKSGQYGSTNIITYNEYGEFTSYKIYESGVLQSERVMSYDEYGNITADEFKSYVEAYGGVSRSSEKSATYTYKWSEKRHTMLVVSKVETSKARDPQPYYNYNCTTEYFYDASDLLLKEVSERGTQEFVINRFGISTAKNAEAYTYDSKGFVSEMKYSSGTIYKYSYNASGQVLSMESISKGAIEGDRTNCTYYSNGLMNVYETTGSRVNYTYEYF